MSPSWIFPRDLQGDHHNSQGDHFSNAKMSTPESRGGFLQRSKRFWIVLGALILVIAIGLGVGLGVGLTRGSGSSSPSSPTSTSYPTPPANTTNSNGTFWKPTVGETWQIVLLYPLNDTSPDVSVYDIDLFDNPISTISNLHSQNRRVICYFSAGSYEPDRPDSSNFTSSDKGKELDGWPGEYWIDTNSNNVRNIINARLSLAASKGCDGVDPDNVDAYDNKNGLSLTTSDAVNYVTFLAASAHALNMSLGLKNGGAIVNQTLGMMQWEVNEQCSQYDECDLFRPFIDAGKPVFHIEYPESAPDISASEKKSACADSDGSAQGFSTVLKNMDLDNFMEAC